MIMKYRIIFLLVSIVLLWGCEDMNEKTKKYYGEIVYPAKYDTIYGNIGFERVEIDLLKAGRIPSDQIKLGKAQKTIIRYDDQEIVLNELVSWLNMTKLTQPKIYRFFISTQDEFGNESVPLEYAAIPYTENDLASLVVTSPRIMTSPSSAIIEWPAGLNSLLLTCHGLTYQYTDRDGRVVSGEIPSAPYRFFVANLEMGRSYTVKMRYRVLPLDNGIPILDTLYLDRDLTVNVPSSAGTFTPAEREIMQRNGLTQFNFEAASHLTKLVYPITANSLQDLFYFSNIEEVDFTGGDLFEMNTYTYDRNNVVSTVGGGPFLPFISAVRDVSDTQVLQDLLESGTLKKVRYIPGTMGLDALLAPYVESGVVELVDMPDEVLVPSNFVADGRVQDANFTMDYTFNPATYPAGTGLQNVWQIIPKRRSASFIWALPLDYRWNWRAYKYIKFSFYAPPKSDLTGAQANFQSIWMRFMNYMWAFSQNSAFGQEDSSGSQPRPTFDIPDANLGQWIDYTVDISFMTNRHNRVIVFNIGNERGVDPDRDVSFYLANFRFTK